MCDAEKEFTSGRFRSPALLRENQAFAGTGGVSAHNRDRGYVPAFLDTVSGVAVISRLPDGQPAAVHTYSCLPAGWIARRDRHGRAVALKAGIVAGFWRCGRFYTRAEAARALAQERIEA